MKSYTQIYNEINEMMCRFAERGHDVPSKCNLGYRAWKTIKQYHLKDSPLKTSIDLNGYNTMYFYGIVGTIQLVIDIQLALDEVVMDGITLYDFIAEDIILGLTHE